MNHDFLVKAKKVLLLLFKSYQMIVYQIIIM